MTSGGDFDAAVQAIIGGDSQRLRELLDAHPELVHQRSTSWHHATLLHYVSANGVEDELQKTPPNIVEIARLLLDRGADVNAACDAYGGNSRTLGLTATSVHPEAAGVANDLMQLLLDRGGTPELAEPELIVACLANGRPLAAEFLAAHGAALDFEGAAGVGDLDRVKALLPATKKETVEKGFVWACAYGRNDVVQLLLDAGVDIAAGAVTNMTALHLAAHEGHLDTVNLLLAHGAPTDVLNMYGGTVLGQALWSLENHPRPEHAAIIEILAAEARRNAEASRRAGDGENAVRLYEEAVWGYRATNNPLRLAHTIRHLGDVHHENGRDDIAAPLIEEALAIYRADDPEPLDLANCIRSLAVIRDDEALWEEAHRLYVATNIQPGVDETARRLERLRGGKT